MYKVGDTCFYYETKERKLKECTIQSVRKTEYDNGDGFEITSIEYSAKHGGTYTSGIGPELLFMSKEEFLKSII